MELKGNIGSANCHQLGFPVDDEDQSKISLHSKSNGFSDVDTVIETPDCFASMDRFQQPTGCSSSNPVAFPNTETSWLKGEITAEEILHVVHPTMVSEQRRRAVTNYIRRLLKDFPGIELYPVGSTPLKTYLPHGDIDLSAFCSQNQEENLRNHVLAVLKREEQNSFAEFEVRDVKCRNAEVKVITCNVQKLSLDITFNQLGGLRKLWFLEQVDQKIGKNHIFKRSIIFIKSWCYYESHILGARCSLLSSYALETLVLYIFQLFHSSIDGPLSAFYKFLDYYENFDWVKYCISLSGPVCRSSLPEIVVEKSDKEEGELLLSKGYLKYCAQMLSIPQNMYETKPFFPKYINIIDPLKENNNLGRSICKANFYRIRSCFSHAAQDFHKILTLPEERTAVEIRKRFSKILGRHASESDFHAYSLQEGIHHIRISSEPCPVIVDRPQRHGGDARELGTSIGCHGTEDSMADLSGDYEYHFRSLTRAHCCITGVFFTAPVSYFHREFPPQHWYDQWHISLNRSSWLEHNAFDNVSTSYLVPVLPVYSERFIITPGALIVTPGAIFGQQEMQTPQGIGTFIPRTNNNLMPMISNVFKRPNVGVHMALSEENPNKGSEQRVQEEIRIPSVENELVSTVPPENHLALVNPTSEVSKSHTSNTPEGSASSKKPVMQEVNLETERVVLQSYILEDNDDFPPLPTLHRK